MCAIMYCTYITCGNYINYGINDYIHEAETRDFVPGHVWTYLHVALKKHFCVTLLSHMQIVASRVTTSGV